MSKSFFASDEGTRIKKSLKMGLDTATSTTSRELHFADKFYTSGGNDMNIVQKSERVSTRPNIPATKCEKLTYIRSYVSSMGKTDILGVHRVNYNELFWEYLHRIFMKTLPTCYISLFLGSYANEHHLFLPKMAPLMHGVKYIWILIGSIQLLFFSNMIIPFLDYVVAGVLYQEPWNRCEIKNYRYRVPTENGSTITNVFCYTLNQFIEKNSNKSVLTRGKFFYDPDAKVFFQLSHHFYIIFRESYIKYPIAHGISLFVVYKNILWILSSLLINQIFKKHIWKILHIFHWLLAGVLACILLFFYYFSAIHEEINAVVLQPIPELKEKGLDLILVAESMATPPILHILTSRSKEEVKLSTDTGILVASNTLFYLFRAYVVDQLMKYCVFITKSQLHVISDVFNIHYLWPIFFWSINLNKIITIPFCTLILFVDYLTFTITHQCLIEVIVCEWPYIKRWQTAVLLCIFMNLLVQRTLDVVLWFVVHGIYATIYTELIIIAVLYPFGRLVEDITFHDGIAPSFIIIFGLRLMWLYYVINFFVLLYNGGLILKTEWNRNMTLTFLVILLMGLFIKLYDIISKKKNWKLIFLPVREWGPLDFTLRLLRKKFDSSNYIASQGPRDLSRYLIQKAEPKTYRLNVRYEPPPKSQQYVRPTN